MAQADFRRLVDVGPWGYVAIEVVDDNAERPIRIDVSSLHVELSDADAGLVFDTLAQGIRTVVLGRGLAKLDTPHGDDSRGMSSPSGNL